MSSTGSSTSAVIYSVMLHAVIVLAFALEIDFWRTDSSAPEQPDAIQASVVDSAVLEQTQAEPEAEPEPEPPEPEPEPEPEREPEPEPEPDPEAELERQQEEAERQAELERQQEEAERQAELERQREEAERQAELERQREEAERQAELERQREAERQAELERQRQQELEEQLQRELAAEAEQRQAREAGLLDEYRRDIQNVIRQNWNRPESAQPGIECVVNVRQIPSGDVVDVSVGRCNGDAAVVRSIESAVLRASPLPKPPVPALFERNLDIIFSPDD